MINQKIKVEAYSTGFRNFEQKQDYPVPKYLCSKLVLLVVVSI